MLSDSFSEKCIAALKSLKRLFKLFQTAMHKFVIQNVCNCILITTTNIDKFIEILTNTFWDAAKNCNKVIILDPTPPQVHCYAILLHTNISFKD